MTPTPATRLAIVLGDQLFPEATHELGLGGATAVWMAEDRELCTHFRYHKHKLTLFLSAMRGFAERLQTQRIAVTYSALDDDTLRQPYLERLAGFLDAHPDIERLVTYEIEDDFFAERVRAFAKTRGLRLETVVSPGFLTSREEFAEYDRRARKPFMASFYQEQRLRLGVLVDGDGKPAHGRWSFDVDNRKRLPRGYPVPPQPSHAWTEHTRAVTQLVDRYFAAHPGDTSDFWLATTRERALAQLDDFLAQRFTDFGPYEDAFETDGDFLFHSVLSPYINVGLITPAEVIDRALAHAESHATHYPSVEGFVRQIIGWREFIRGMYRQYGARMQAGNFFAHERRLTDDWWRGTTAIAPVDDCIRRVRRHGYLHHIERLMVMGNVMLLAEIHPDDVYRWFMEMFVDSGDWVMVPNVYGMSQYADGGIFATKPYICNSAYWSKMSHYGRDPAWADVVDGLYWRFVERKAEVLGRNPRMGAMLGVYARMAPEKRERLGEAAGAWLGRYTVS